MCVCTVPRTRGTSLDENYKHYKKQMLDLTAGKKRGIHKIQFASFPLYRDYSVLLALVSVI